MTKSISDRTDLTEEQKEIERKKLRKFREELINQNTIGMTLEQRVERLERIISGE